MAFCCSADCATRSDTAESSNIKWQQSTTCHTLNEYAAPFWKWHNEHGEARRGKARANVSRYIWDLWLQLPLMGAESCQRDNEGGACVCASRTAGCHLHACSVACNMCHIARSGNVSLHANNVLRIKFQCSIQVHIRLHCLGCMRFRVSRVDQKTMGMQFHRARSNSRFCHRFASCIVRWWPTLAR